MEIAPSALIVGACLLVLGYCLRAPIVVPLFGSLAFGSTAIATLPAVGGVTVLLYVPFAGLLILSVLARRSFWSDLSSVFARHWLPGGIAVLVAYSVASAIIMPRLFMGQTTVFVPLDGAVVETVLMPVSGNMNQAGYFALGALTFFAVSILLIRQRSLASIKTGFLAFASIHAVLGLVDLAGKIGGAGDVLSVLRTADYSMHVEVQVAGFWRIVGGFPEASAFAGASLIGLAFAFSYWRYTGDRWMLVLWSVLLLLLLLSTSTTGYAGLGLLLLIFAISWLWRLLFGGLNRQDLAVVVLAVVVLTTVLGAYVFHENAFKPVASLIEATLLDKSTSASADERFYWNQKSLKAFFDTYGLGVGLGSSRASSSFIAILSQLGVLGAILFGFLFLEIAKRPIRRPHQLRDHELVALCGALRSAGAATIVGGALAAGGADPGILFYIIVAGLLAGRARLSEGAYWDDIREGEHRMRQWDVGLPPTGHYVSGLGPASGFAYEAPVAEHHSMSRHGNSSVGLSDDDWAVVLMVFRACLPRRGGSGRDDQRFLEALLYYAVHGISWRALPEEFGNWNSIWKRYWRLSRAGVFTAFLQALSDMRGNAHLVKVFDSSPFRDNLSAAGVRATGNPPR